jgi:hypothetical protein
MNAKAPPSGKVISFQAKPAKPRFAQAREVWVRWCCADLTPAERNVVTSLATYFNAQQFKKWGELVAWPAWETLISEWSLSRTTIWRALQKLEHRGKLEVTHGGINPSTGHKLGNKYRAYSPPQGFRLKRGQVSNTRFQPETRLDDSRFDESSDSTTQVSKKELQARVEEFDDCLPKGPRGPEASKQAEEGCRPRGPRGPEASKQPQKESGPWGLKTRESHQGPSDFILAELSFPHLPSSAGSSSPQPKPIESGLAAALGRLGRGVRGNGGLIAGSSTWPAWHGGKWKR